MTASNIVVLLLVALLIAFIGPFYLIVALVKSIVMCAIVFLLFILFIGSNTPKH